MRRFDEADSFGSLLNAFDLEFEFDEFEPMI